MADNRNAERRRGIVCPVSGSAIGLSSLSEEYVQIEIALGADASFKQGRGERLSVSQPRAPQLRTQQIVIRFQSTEATSPAARVTNALSVSWSIVSAKKRTEPSPKPTLAPELWKLKIPVALVSLMP